LEIGGWTTGKVYGNAIGKVSMTNGKKSKGNDILFWLAHGARGTTICRIAHYEKIAQCKGNNVIFMA